MADRTILNEGFQAIPAEVPSSGDAQKEGNVKKFKTFVVDPIDEGKGETAQDILNTLLPNSVELLYKEETKHLIYDLEFFASIEMGDAFIDIWKIIVDNDNDINKENAIQFLKIFFSATSQIALKMEMLRQDSLHTGEAIETFDKRFDEIRERDFLAKFNKKIIELGIEKQYYSLCKDFEPLYHCTENIIYHSLKHFEDIDFGLIGLSLGKIKEETPLDSPEDINDETIWPNGIPFKGFNRN